eukprot:5443308-Pyramimonas_sp.AAC.1
MVSASQECWADLMKIPSHSGGLECRAMYLKQCRSIGLQTWLDMSSWLSHPKPSDVQPEDVDSVIQIRFFIFSSDNGPDQAKADRLIRDDIADQLYTLMLRAWCIRHQLHLCVTGDWGGVLRAITELQSP